MRRTFHRWMRRRTDRAQKKIRMLAIRKAMLARGGNMID
jgi:hypothetical protein